MYRSDMDFSPGNTVYFNPYENMVGEWIPEYDAIRGVITGYWRPTAVDDSRGARQTGVVPGSDTAFEFVPADQFNGGNFDPSALQYGTSGTNIVQHNNEPFPGASTLVKLAPLLIAGAGIGSAAAAGEFGSLGGLLGGTEGAAGGMSSVGSSTPVIDSIVGQSTIPGAAYTSTSGSLFGPGAAFGAEMSLASPGAFSGVLPETAAAWGSGLVPAENVLGYTSPITPYEGTPPAGGTTPPPATTKPGGLLDKVFNGGLGALGASDWAKIVGALGGGALSYLDAQNQNGKTQGGAPDVYAKLMGAQQAPARQPVVGQYTNQMTGLLGQQNPALAGLLAKRYY